MRSQIFPYHDVTLATFSDWIAELEGIRVIKPFQTNGESYYYICKFSQHQKVEKPSKTRNPEPPDGIREGSGKEQGTLPRILPDYSPTTTR